MNQSISEQIKKEAEDVFGEDSPSLIDAFLAGASFRESLTGMRWVKWSDRIPDDWEGKINRQLSTKTVLDNSNWEHKNNRLEEDSERHPPYAWIEYDDIEWLDESPMKSEGAEERGWVSVKNKLPDPADNGSADQWKLCLTDFGAALLTLHYYDHELKLWFNGANPGAERRIAYWMDVPLPPAPLTEK